MKIPLVDLKVQYKSMKHEIDTSIQKVIDNTSFIMGSEVTEFEQAFANYCESESCVALSSGTDALHLVLHALGIGPEDEVITTPFTFIATAEAITMCGARPVFCDIDLDTYNLDPNDLETKITHRTKAVIPVHLYGQPANMAPIRDIAKRYNLYLIEDAAQAHGARYYKKRVGSLADVACFSFYPGKNLGAYGDAGAVVTNNKEIADKVALLRDHGRMEKYQHLIPGFGNRMDTIQAAILLTKLKHLDQWNYRRRENAKIYSTLLMGSTVKLPFVPEWCEPVWHQYVIRSRERDRLRSDLNRLGVSSGIHYPIPLHLQPAYQYLGYKIGDFPNSEIAAAEVLSLPMYPELGQEELGYISELICRSVN